MAEITASMVRDLRDKTDAPMMECKKALVEAEGNSAKAEELLRIRLGNKASRAAARTAVEGVVAVYVAPDARTGAIVEVNCETDFVAKTEDFREFAASLAELVTRRSPADLAALNALPLGGATVDEARKALFGRVRENISIRRFARIDARGRLSQYIHGEAKKIGVLVDISGGNDQLGRDLAMHIAASKPLALSRDDVPAELLKKERAIARQGERLGCGDVHGQIPAELVV